MTRSQIKWAAIVLLTAFAVAMLYPTINWYMMDAPQRERLEAARLRPKHLLNLGLDLRGGSHLLMELDGMLAALKKGDRVLTNGGFYVTVTSVRGADLEVKLGEEKVVMTRSSVTRLANHPELASAAAAAEKA